MALRDVLVSFGIDVTGKSKLDEVDKSLTGLIDKANLLAKAFVGIAIAKGITSFITDVVDMGAKISDTANRLGIGTDELQQFQYAAGMVGVSGEMAARSLQFLERNIGQMEMGAKATAKTFAGFGVNLRDAHGDILPMNELLPAVADGFSKLKDQPTQAAYAVKLFGRAGAAMLPVLRAGKEGLREYYKQFELLGGGLQSDFIEKAKDADRGMRRLGLAFDTMKSRIVYALIDPLSWLMAQMIKVASYFGQLSDRTYGARTALIALGVVAAAALLPLLIELAPIVLLVGALYLAFDELFTLFQGGDTLIGDFIDSIFGDGTAQEWVKNIKEGFQDFLDLLLTEFIPWLISMGELLKSVWEAAKPYLKEFADNIRLLLKDIMAIVDALGGLRNLLSTAFDNTQLGITVKMLGHIKGLLHGLGGGTTAEDMDNQGQADAASAAIRNMVGAAPSARAILQGASPQTGNNTVGVPAGIQDFAGVGQPATAPNIDMGDKVIHIHLNGAYADNEHQEVAKKVSDTLEEANRKDMAAIQSYFGPPAPIRVNGVNDYAPGSHASKNIGP